MKPGKIPFYLPSSRIATELSAILCFGLLSVSAMRANQFDTFFRKLFSQRIAIICPISYQSFGQLFYHANTQGIFDQFYFVSIGSGGPYGDRKTSSVCDCHDLGALAPLSFSNMIPPFLALEKVPSMKHSSISISPISLRC